MIWIKEAKQKQDKVPTEEENNTNDANVYSNSTNWQVKTSYVENNENDK